MQSIDKKVHGVHYILSDIHTKHSKQIGYNIYPGDYNEHPDRD